MNLICQLCHVTVVPACPNCGTVYDIERLEATVDNVIAERDNARAALATMTAARDAYKMDVDAERALRAGYRECAAETVASLSESLARAMLERDTMATEIARRDENRARQKAEQPANRTARAARLNAKNLAKLATDRANWQALLSQRNEAREEVEHWREAFEHKQKLVEKYVNEGFPPLLWTTALPVSPGWYWRRDELPFVDENGDHRRHVYVVKVEAMRGARPGLLFVACVPIDNLGGEWAGPLHMPAEG